MLPKDIEARNAKAEAEAAATSLVQATLDGHIQPIAPSETVVKYSDARFREAAENWLIATNQVRSLV